MELAGNEAAAGGSRPYLTNRDVLTLSVQPALGAQRRVRIEVSSPPARTLSSVRDPDLTNRDVPTLAKQPALGAKRRARIEVSSPAARTPPSVPDKDQIT